MLCCSGCKVGDLVAAREPGGFLATVVLGCSKLGLKQVGGRSYPQAGCCCRAWAMGAGDVGCNWGVVLPLGQATGIVAVVCQDQYGGGTWCCSW